MKLKILVIIILALAAVGCTRLNIEGVGTYTRVGTSFNGTLEKTSDTLRVEIGSEPNREIYMLPGEITGAVVR